MTNAQTHFRQQRGFLYAALFGPTPDQPEPIQFWWIKVAGNMQMARITLLDIRGWLQQGGARETQ